jgi:ATP-GRASP peptide maturase of grasp-with-spasm system
VILILSQTVHEPTTEFVMDWLERLGARCLRLNGEDFDGDCGVSLRLSGAGTELVIDDDDHDGDDGDGGGTPLPLEQVQAVWYRRWQRHLRHGAAEMVDRRHGIAQQLRIDLYRHLNMEARKLAEVLFARLAGVPWLAGPATVSPNKLLVLERAAAAGLDIPATLVTTHRAELERFAADHAHLITKAVSEARSFYLDGRFHVMHTVPVEPADIAALPASFPASLFQEQLAKKYELRVFYLAGECHAMAIFSQNDPQTRIDFRNYNFARPNRNVPYRLPDAVAAAIDALMRGLGLETGSLDLVRTTDGRMVFLEVNPNGQFTMVSKPCNYHLERKVAEAMIRKAADGRT